MLTKEALYKALSVSFPENFTTEELAAIDTFVDIYSQKWMNMHPEFSEIPRWILFGVFKAGIAVGLKCEQK